MSTTKTYKDFVLEQLSLLDSIKSKPMMGGYLFYYQNILFGGLYGGDYFYVKIVESNKKYNLKKQIPYEGSKTLMYLIDNLDNQELLKDIVIDTCKDLKTKEKEKL